MKNCEFCGKEYKLDWALKRHSWTCLKKMAVDIKALSNMELFDKTLDLAQENPYGEYGDQWVQDRFDVYTDELYGRLKDWLATPTISGEIS